MQCFKWHRSKKPKIHEYIISITELKDNDGKEPQPTEDSPSKKVPFEANDYLKPELKSSHSFTKGVNKIPMKPKISLSPNVIEFKSKTMCELKGLSKLHSRSIKDEDSDGEVQSSICTVY